jgi:hypothetical protein
VICDGGGALLPGFQVEANGQAALMGGGNDRPYGGAEESGTAGLSKKCEKEVIPWPLLA